MMLRAGTSIWIYPHGKDNQKVRGTVVTSDGPPTAQGILVTLEEIPPWAKIPTGFAGKLFMALRNYGMGPWIEVRQGGHYEIEI